VVGGGTVVDVVEVVVELLVEVVELVGVVDEVLVLDPGTVLDVVDVAGAAVMTKSSPTAEVPALVHTSRVALAPAGLDGRAAVLVTKGPPAPPSEVNGVVLSGVPVGSAPENTSNTPSVVPDPLGQPVPVNWIVVPGGPVGGSMT